HRAPALVDDGPGPGRRARADERDAITPGDEAHVHALGLRRGAQPQLLGPGPYLGLGELPDGEERTAQLALAQHVQDVRLVLGGVAATEQAARAVGVRADPGAVSR